MCRILILDDEKNYADAIQQTIVNRSSNSADVAYQLESAIEKSLAALKNGKAYDIFLIDQVLGPGKHGIQAMQELRQLSPDTDAIILTGFNDSEIGLKAYQAGAFRYLPKGFENEELLYLVEQLKERRKVEREHGWQNVFISMMEDGLKPTSFQDVSQVVVEHALRLGFQRAHLFWLPNGDEFFLAPEQMLGVCSAGKNCLPDFGGKFYSLQKMFGIDISSLEREPVFFWPQPGDLNWSSKSYQLPAGEWCLLPLSNETALLGVLVLDYDQLIKNMSTQERTLLGLYARQASIVLHHASIYNRERLTSQEMSLVNEIGRQTNTDAAAGNLADLLESIYELIKKRFSDASDFTFVIADHDAHELDFVLHYQEGQKLSRQTTPAGQGLEGYLIEHPDVVFLPKNFERYIQENAIPMLDKKIPASWMGVPLMVNDNVIGCISIKHYDRTKRLHMSEKRLLASIANQVAGAIQACRLSELERKDLERLQVLQESSLHMMRVMQEREDEKLLWRILLTVVTADFGLGFNRALLLRTRENNTCLEGEMGIGTDDRARADADWKKDKKRHYTFEKFLAEAGHGKIYPTDYENLIRQVKIPLTDHSSVLKVVMDSSTMVVLQESELESNLPPDIFSRFSLGHCAILPLRAGDKKLGLVIVDNKHNHRSLEPRTLTRLQTLLDNAGLVLETLYERNKSESLLNANHEILSGAGKRSLADTLNQICSTAQVISEADWAFICPLLPSIPGKQPYILDLGNIGFHGNLQDTSIQDVMSEQPQAGGVSTMVIRKGELVIPDIDVHDSQASQPKLSEHHFIRREGVKALIGVAVHDPFSGQPIGLLYLDYRRKREFSKLEIRHARSFANLAAIAISYPRSKGLEPALQIATALSTETNRNQIIDTAMKKMQEFFGDANLCVLQYKKDENALIFAPGVLKYYKAPNYRLKKKDTFKLGEGTIACRVAKKSMESGVVELENVPNVQKDPDYRPYNPTVKSEMCVTLLDTQNQLLGVLALERSRLNGFSIDDELLAKMVAKQISLAFERAEQKEALDFKSSVAALTSWAADIAHDVKNEVGKILTYTYLIQEEVGQDSLMWQYANQIKISTDVLLSAGPWSSQPDQVLELDHILPNELQKLASQKGIRAELRLGAPGALIKINLAEFQRVLKQLIRNASRAMSDINDKHIQVTTFVEKDNGSVKILFKDFGPGVSEDVRDFLFQRPITTKARGQGGSGLLLTREMVEDMHGSIALLPTRSGQGAVFVIQFPVASPYDSNVE